MEKIVHLRQEKKKKKISIRTHQINTHTTLYGLQQKPRGPHIKRRENSPQQNEAKIKRYTGIWQVPAVRLCIPTVEGVGEAEERHARAGVEGAGHRRS